MENFAVDLDKVLDEFELDEDENEGSNSYDKLHLEFHDNSSPSLLQSARSSNNEEWGNSICKPPPGNRSPPDGQHDEPELHCIDASLSEENSDTLSSFCLTKSKKEIPSESNSSQELTGLKSNTVEQAPRNENNLWPHLYNNASIDSNTLSVCEPVNPIPVYNELDQGNQQQSDFHPRHLDILPETVLPKTPRHDVQHPDIIGLENSRADVAGAYAFNHSFLPQMEDEASPSLISDRLVLDAQHDVCLLPDLTLSNNDRGFSPDPSNPDVVTENRLQSNICNEPALVRESKLSSRIPEVANIHQSAELGVVNIMDSAPMNEVQGLLFPSIPERVADMMVNCDAPDVSLNASVCDERLSLPLPDVSAVCEVSLQNVKSVDSESIEQKQEDSGLKFDPNHRVEDDELHAALAELEDEQCSSHQNVDTPDKDSEQGLEEVQTVSEQHAILLPQEAQPIIPEEVCASQESLEQKTSFAQWSSGFQPDTNLAIPSINTLATNTPFSSNQVFETDSKFSSNSMNKTAESQDDTSSGSSGTDTTSSSSTLVDGDLESHSLDLVNTSAEPPTIGEIGCEGAEGGALADPNASTELSCGRPSPVVGTFAPFWIPDDEAVSCQQCDLKFTMIRRRHHCRGCGRVLCAACCHEKAPLPYMNYKEARVCTRCLMLLTQVAEEEEQEQQYQESRPMEQPDRPPNPNNPMEYCSRVPISQQAATSVEALPTVMVPVGILKRDNTGVDATSAPRVRANKQVIFMDGIQPGGDLSECPANTSSPYRRSGRPGRRSHQTVPGSVKHVKGRFSLLGRNPTLQSLPADECLIPIDGGLPPVLVEANRPGEYKFDASSNSVELNRRMQQEGPPVVFAILRNLTVLVKRIKLDCCIGLEVWNLATRGLCTVGQEELVVLLEVNPGETSPPAQIFTFFHTVYQQANKGNLVTELGHTIFTEPEGFLGSKDHVGFLYIRPSFQCMTNLVLPPAPFIFAVLILKWETPWAKVFPLRLMLRLGAEFRYYPCPLVSCRNRKPVFGEIGHTIMSLLVDFRNYTYTIPMVQGLLVHMEDKLTTVLIPRNRYEQVWKALDNSNDHVLALSANFSPQADSHLVTVEDDDGNYSTQAINIHNRPRKMTGASFIVFNGALNSSSGLKAKSSIVEDGLMVQIPGNTMANLREALRNLKDFEVACGPTNAPSPDEIVVIRWTQDDKNFNIGIKSAVDARPMDGVPSLKIHSGTDYVSNGYVIRWTEIYIIQGETNNGNGDVNMSRLSESLSRACCVALTNYLKLLYSKGQNTLALRATIHQDNVEYEVGGGGRKMPPACLNDLDAELIPVIHQAAANITDQPLILELVFHILEQ